MNLHEALQSRVQAITQYKFAGSYAMELSGILRALCLIALLSIGGIGKAVATSPGPGYFVDAVNGSDSNLGSFAAPWRSLSKLLAVRLRAGEGIYLRCGGVWRERLDLTALQLIDGATLSAYGDDCNASNKPRITAADDFSRSWVNTGGISWRLVPADLPKIEKLFVNGVQMRKAQWPDYGGVGHEYALVANAALPSSSAISLSTVDRAALEGRDLAGATVQLRTAPWVIEQRTVDAMGSKSLALRQSTSISIESGAGFVLQDKLWMLTPGEFFHDTARGVLYVYPQDAATQGNMNSPLVEGMVRDIALCVDGRSSLTLKNIAVDMARTDGLTVNNAPAAVLDGIDASNNLGAGVRVNLPVPPAAPARGATIRNGRYVGNSNSGIDTGNAANVDILLNTVTSTAMEQADWGNAAIIGGDGAVINQNTIQKSGFRGILFSGTGGTRVTNNLISEYCARLSDCAAIYTVNHEDRRTAQSSFVQANRIVGGTLNVEGTTNGKILAGIYLDDLSRGVSIGDNTLTGMPIGIYVHNSSNNVVEDNKIWLTTNVCLMANMDRTTGDLMTGNVFRRNQLMPASSVAGVYPALPKITSSQAIRFWHALYGTNSLTSGGNAFSANQVVAFNGDTSVMADAGSAAQSTWLDAKAWKALNPGEIAPSAPATYAIYHSTLGSELLTGNEFEAGLGDWAPWFALPGTGGSAVPVTGINGCNQRCITLTTGQLGDRLSSPNFNMSAGTQYLISFTAVFGGTADITHPNIAQPDTPYQSFVDAQGLRSRNTTLSGKLGDVIRYEAFFTSSSSDIARVNLRVATPHVPVAFDSVSLHPVTGYTVSNFKDWGAVITSPINSSTHVSCADLGWQPNCTAMDNNGNPVVMPTGVGNGITKMLLWANSPWRN